jgi:Holliday junction DNA helicase RuvB
LFQVDELGLDKVDRALLDAACSKFGGGPVGLNTLAVAIGEAPETVEDVYEPYLLQLGMLMRTPRGRVATGMAWQHLGLEPPAPSPLAPPAMVLPGTVVLPGAAGAPPLGPKLWG